MTSRIFELRDNVAHVQARIVAACNSCGRDPKSVTLVWVSKTRPVEDVEAAIAAGAVHFGENRVQECLEKFPLQRPGTELHVIGPVQSNKWRKAAQVAQWIHSVDSIDALRKYDEVSRELGKSLQVLFQVNVSEEQSKSGLSMAYAPVFLDSVPKFPNLRFRGLMTIGRNTGNLEDSRQGFHWLRELRDNYHAKGGHFCEFTEISMGMTDDLEVAVQEGSTLVRVGTALFGARHYP